MSSSVKLEMPTRSLKCPQQRISVEQQPPSHKLKASGIALEASGLGLLTQEESLVQFSNESIRLNMPSSAQNSARCMQVNDDHTVLRRDYQRISTNIENPTRRRE